jgi:hypothetical protein
MMEQDSICLQGAPIYVPKGYGKYIQQEMIDHVKTIEKYYNDVTPNNTFYALEEEYPLAYIAKKCTGIGFLDLSCYRHGFIFPATYNIDHGFETPEKIIGINVFEKYLKQYV